ncbi:MAG: DUF5110 domain-containing protein, partial [Clostridia bacterium]|nr:DUF5110 domain-containing protein [Clostridia bacterium]
MERTDISYGNYIEAQENDQYLLGDYVLVTPLNAAGPSTKIPDNYLSHDGATGRQAGLKAEYYNSKDWTGASSVTTDRNVFFNWGTGGPSGFSNDNFSIKWSGYFTVGDLNATLSFFADDAVIVSIDGVEVINGATVYDTMLTTPVYQAGTTHSIEIKYAEFAGNAHVYMYYTEQSGDSASFNSRDVFIPDGTWIDVWSGTRYVGPNTYTVSHPLETSPIFVREGSLVFIADNATNTRQQVWDNLVLDVYPSKNFNATATLYEDDTNTVAYKSGYYRTTDVDMTFDSTKNALIITINPAEGAFSGVKSFTERSWNIRLHSNEDWGNITNVTIAGQSVSPTKIDKGTYKNGARPFAFKGASLDSDIYELSIDKTNIYSKIVIEVYYESATDSLVNTNYDDTAIKFTMVAQDSGDIIDLDKEGKISWVSYGDTSATDIVKKDNVTNPFSFPTSYDIPWANFSNNFTTQYSYNGKTIASMGGISSHKNLHFTIDTIGTEAYYVIYLGGNQSTAKVTVSDRAGNRVTEYIGNINGKYSNRIVIHVTDTTVSKLYVTFAMHASEFARIENTATSATGGTSPSNVTLFACLVSDEIPAIHTYKEGNLTASVLSTTDATGSACLTTYGETFGEETLDWIHTGNDGGVTRVRKYGGNNVTNLAFENYNAFYDYAMSLSYFDGDELGAHTGSTKGTCSTGSITLNVLITPNVKHIVLFTGAWRSSNQVFIYDRLGNFLCASELFTAGESSVCKVVKISVSALETDLLTIKIFSSNPGVSGNVSLPAVVVTGTTPEKTTSSSLVEAQEVSGNINLTEVGQTDWFHLASLSKKQGATALSTPTNVVMGGVYDFNTYGASISYTDGTDGAKTGLTNGKQLDFARFNVTLEKGYNYLDLFVAVKNCKAGVHLLDSNNSIIGSYIALDNDTETLKSLQVRILLNCEKAETITVIYYKGGNGAGFAYLVGAALTSNATPTTGLTSTVNVTDVAGQSIYLNNSDSSLDTLYWEHYSTSGLESMLNAEDLVVSNSITTANNFGFNDYKATLNWLNGTNNVTWITNTNGLCAGNTEYEIQVKVNQKVKAIKVFTGAWRATGTATLYHDGILKATSSTWTTGDDGIARCVTFTINTSSEEVVTIKITPSEVGENGNVSMVAVSVLGVNTTTQTTTLNLTTTEMKDYNQNKYSLTSLGTQDWYYANYEHNPDRKNGGTLIDANSLKVESNGKMWDYKAAFNWTDGTTNATSPIDNDCNNAGTNNGVCGAYVKISATVTSATKNVYLWIGGYQSEYYLEVIDSKGNVLLNSLMHGVESGKTYAYLCDLAITATASEKLTFIVYRTSNGGDCSLAAIALNGDSVQESKVTASASVTDIAGQSIYLNNADTTKETLYWEHYSSGTTEKMLNASDIVSNSAESITRGFGDYKATLNWTNGTNNVAWITNNSGLCEGTEFTINVNITPSVTAILIYTGAWRATGTATLSFNGQTIATSESWTAGDDGIARLVKFNVSTVNNEIVTIKVTPTAMGDGGNVSMVAVAVIGNNTTTKNVYATLSTTEMTGTDTCKYNLSEYGTQDWYYPNYDAGNPEEKNGGTAIDTSSLVAEGNGTFWDYKAAFTWTDGTVNPNGYQDNDLPENTGSNNGKCGAYVKVNVTVTKDTKNVYLWVGGWKSTYYAEVIDSKGNVIAHQLMHEATDTTYAYLCDFAIEASSVETLTLAVYRTAGPGNTSLAAIAVKN